MSQAGEAAATQEDPGHEGLWAQSAWQAGIQAWANAKLQEAGHQAPGLWEAFRIKPWAAVFRKPDPQGDWWLKAPGPGTAFEAGLYRLLHEVAPEWALAPLALEVAKGWMLLPDGGKPLGESALDPVGSLPELLSQYAGFQRRVAPHSEALLALGVMDMRPERLPSRYQEALAMTEAFAHEGGLAEDMALWARLKAFTPQVEAWCEQLAQCPVGSSLDHHDLHPWNILPEGQAKLGRVRFFDWGDSVVGHPFMSLLIALGHAKMKLKCHDLDPALVLARDAYLAHWQGVASHEALVQSQVLACRLALVSRSLVWQRAIQSGGEAVASYRRAPLQSLAYLLEEAHLVMV